MMRTGQKIEPPLVKSLSWQRKQARGHSIEGYLMKVGKTLRSIVTRWYVIRDNFMSDRSDCTPRLPLSSVTASAVPLPLRC